MDYIHIPKQSKTRDMGLALVELSLAAADRQPQTSWPSTREAYGRRPGSGRRVQGRLHRDGDNGAGPWMRSRSPDGGEGGKHIPSRGNST